MKINEKGRSMIEMLGVLAIIGVLSVGGIAGYSKAMAKFRANKTMDQISHIVANVRILFGSQRNYSDLGGKPGNAYLIYSAHLFPEEMLGGDVPTAESSDMASFSNPYAGSVKLYAAPRFKGETACNVNASDQDAGSTTRTTAACKAFIIEYYNVPKDACIDLASQNWDASSGSGLIAFGIAAESEQVAAAETVDKVYYDDCKTSGEAYQCFSEMPMPVSKAIKLCTGDTNTLSFKFY